MCAVILESLGAIKAASMRIDLSVGKFDAGFTQLMRPNTGGGQDTGVFNFNLIDTLADGLQAQRVRFSSQANLIWVIKRDCSFQTAKHQSSQSNLASPNDKTLLSNV